MSYETLDFKAVRAELNAPDSPVRREAYEEYNRNHLGWFWRMLQNLRRK